LESEPPRASEASEPPAVTRTIYTCQTAAVTYACPVVRQRPGLGVQQLASRSRVTAAVRRIDFPSRPGQSGHRRCNRPSPASRSGASGGSPEDMPQYSALSGVPMAVTAKAAEVKPRAAATTRLAEGNAADPMYQNTTSSRKTINFRLPRRVLDQRPTVPDGRALSRPARRPGVKALLLSSRAA
jgi:hypothetical protein